MRERVDRHELHEYLFRLVNRRGVVRLQQNKLAKGLDISKWTMSRIVHEMIDDGRLKKIPDSVDRYVIQDPGPWRN